MGDKHVERELRSNFMDQDYAHTYAEDFLNGYIATQLKVLREDRELKQADLAELAGMKQSRISLMEDVNYGSWNLKTLRRLAEALDVALVVRFESFSTFIKEVASFSRESLRRPSRTEDLGAQRSVDELVNIASQLASSTPTRQQTHWQSALSASAPSDGRPVRHGVLSGPLALTIPESTGTQPTPSQTAISAST